MAINADEFRAAMGAWPSGVTIITARAGDKIHGMTVSDFSGEMIGVLQVYVAALVVFLAHFCFRFCEFVRACSKFDPPFFFMCWLVCWLLGCLVDWLAGGFVGWEIGRLIGWLIDWLLD